MSLAQPDKILGRGDDSFPLAVFYQESPGKVGLKKKQNLLSLHLLKSLNKGFNVIQNVLLSVM